MHIILNNSHIIDERYNIFNLSFRNVSGYYEIDHKIYQDANTNSVAWSVFGFFLMLRNDIDICIEIGI